MKRIAHLSVLLFSVAVSCGDDESRYAVDFSPGVFEANPLAPAEGEPVDFRVTGGFSVAEIYQGDDRVALTTRPDEVATFVSRSTDAPRAIVWGNDSGDRVELSPRALAPDAAGGGGGGGGPLPDTCVLNGTYQAFLDFVETGGDDVASCTFPEASARFNEIIVEDGGLSVTIQGVALTVASGPLFPLDLSTAEQDCTFHHTTSNGLLTVTIARFADRVQLWVDEALNASDSCYQRWTTTRPP